MTKHQPFGMKELALEANPPAAGPASVSAVPADWMADGRQVGADLVRAARFEPEAQQRGAREALDKLEMGHRVARTVAARRDDRPAGPVAPDGRVDRAAGGVGVAAHEGEVAALDPAGPHLALEPLVGGLGLRHHEQTRGVAVEAVD